MKIHKLKILPVLYNAIIHGLKTFKIKKNNDHNFKVGDTVILQEWELDGHFYTKRECKIKITYEDFEGIAPGYCVFGIDFINMKKV